VTETTFRVLIIDFLGLAFGPDGAPSPAEIEAYVERQGARFHRGSARNAKDVVAGKVHFFYCPDLSTADEIRHEAAAGYDAVIAAATVIPEDAAFPRGGVRIGAGTGNMRSASWGGGNGVGGTGVLMNTPGVNSRATAQMVFKALLRRRPDLPLEHLHALTVAGAFDTGRNLREYPTRKLESYRLAVIGFGNIGREVAHLGRAFGMDVVVHARQRHRQSIEAAGLEYAPTIEDAAQRADILSVHVGLGRLDAATGRYANADLIDRTALAALAPGAFLINFDRCEIVEIAALSEALNSGQVGDVAVDADIFVKDGEAPTGPLVSYLPLAKAYPDRVLLLPHAAADTDHPTRVAGAKQAVDQILDLLLRDRVTNLVGDVAKSRP
jgi:lactate dehydrogenase-like 2-hydroxyacid dehydrogenase